MYASQSGGRRTSTEAPSPAIRWLPVVAAALFAALALDAARVETPTIDEFAHLPAGAAYLEHGALGLYTKNPPLLQAAVALPAVLAGALVPAPGSADLAPGWGPWLYGRRFMRDNEDVYLRLFFWGRAVVTLLALATGRVLFVWARQVFGDSAAGIATALFFLCPLVLAHGHLATVDVGCMFTTFLAVFGVRWAYAAPGPVRIAAAGALVGLALLVKFTAVLLMPALAILVAIHRWPRARRAAGEFALLALCAVAVVNLGMGFRDWLRPLGEFEFVSSSARALQRVLPASLPIPLPGDYVRGFDAVRRDTERGEAPVFLLGEWSKRGGWHYNLVALAVKSPLALLAMLASCPLFLVRRRLPATELAAFLVPLVVIFVSLSLFNRATLGVRYLLPVYPFLFLAIAAVWVPSRWSSKLWPLVVGIYAMNAGLQHPNYLAFFNWGVGGPGNGHRILLDSNLDWGQDLYRVPRALEEMGYAGRVGLLYAGHVDPRLYGLDTYLIPEVPNEAVLAVSVSYLMGSRYPVTTPNGELLPIPRSRIAWLRSREPVAKLGSIWLYDTRPLARRGQRGSAP